MQKELVLVRNVNEYIDSKTGRMLAPFQRRHGIDNWLKFENKLTTALKNIGARYLLQLEHPNQEDWQDGFCAKIYCHKNAVDLAPSNVKKLFYMQMHKRTLFTLDSEGWGFRHSQRPYLKQKAEEVVTSQQANDFFNTYISQLKNKKDTKISSTATYSKEFPTFSTSLPSEYHFVPLQVSRDYVIKHYSPCGVADFIFKIGEWAKKSDKPFIIKPHPFNLTDSSIAEALTKVVDNKHVYLSQNHVFDLIERSMAVWLINSGVGFESLYFLKPVVLFGQSDYQDVVIKGTLESFEANLKNILAFNNQHIELYKKFIYYYFNHHAFDLELSPEHRLEEFLTRFLRN